MEATSLFRLSGLASTPRASYENAGHDDCHGVLAPPSRLERFLRRRQILQMVNAIQAHIAAPSTAPHAHSSRGTVLLAEDDRSIRRYLEVMLQRAGYLVTSTADGLEAMKAALESEPDVVITDAVMPHINGHELCRFLRRHPKLSHVPVIILSGIDRDDVHDEPAKADVYMAKPVRPEELAACLERLLARAA